MQKEVRAVKPGFATKSPPGRASLCPAERHTEDTGWKGTGYFSYSPKGPCFSKAVLVFTQSSGQQSTPFQGVHSILPVPSMCCQKLCLSDREGNQAAPTTKLYLVCAAHDVSPQLVLVGFAEVCLLPRLLRPHVRDVPREAGPVVLRERGMPGRDPGQRGVPVPGGIPRHRL